MKGFQAAQGPARSRRWDEISRSQLDSYQEDLRAHGGASGSPISRSADAGIQSRLAKRCRRRSGSQPLRAAAEAQAGDLVILLGVKSDAPRTNLRGTRLTASGWLRLELARKLELIKPGVWSFAWVVDFPMFEYDEKEKRYRGHAPSLHLAARRRSGASSNPIPAASRRSPTTWC